MRAILATSFFAKLVLSTNAIAASIPAEWKYSQELRVSKRGLIKVQLPLETLSQAQPSLADLRVFDPAGQEVSYFVDQPMREPAKQLPLDRMTVTMSKNRTIVVGQVPRGTQSSGFDAIYLYTATDDFLKPITLEISQDKIHWKQLVSNRPIFKQPGEGQSTSVEFPKVNGSYLRLTLDDSATPPIRVQGVTLYTAPKQAPGLQSITAQILETSSDSHQTEMQLLLPADNLMVDALRIETPESTFRRRMTASVKTFSAGEFRESVVGQGDIYQISLNREISEHASIYLGRRVPGRWLILRIENGDSRPLAITRVATEVIPAYLVFDAAAPGLYTVWVGNITAPLMNYDVASLRDDLVRAPIATASFGPLTVNHAYHAPEPLPQVSEQGTDIDLAPWHFRKKLTLKQDGIQRIEPDLEVLSHNSSHPAALRVVRDGKQLPYVVESIGVGRDFQVVLEETPLKKTLSQWILTLPQKGLPVSTLRFAVQEPLFQRNLALYEEVLDERGDTSRQLISQATWARVNPAPQQDFILALYRPPRTNKLFLETDNRENAPIHLASARAYYQTPRLLFKASPGKDIYLYYGHDEATDPHYDLALVASEILATPPLDAGLGAEEALKVKPWWEAPVPAGGMKYAFWVVMGLVVIGLLAVIAKLLPVDRD